MIGNLLAALSLLAIVTGVTEMWLALASLTVAWCSVFEAKLGR